MRVVRSRLALQLVAQHQTDETFCAVVFLYGFIHIYMAQPQFYPPPNSSMFSLFFFCFRQIKKLEIQQAKRGQPG
jgi:hypothetical protein